MTIENLAEARVRRGLSIPVRPRTFGDGTGVSPGGRKRGGEGLRGQRRCQATRGKQNAGILRWLCRVSSGRVGAVRLTAAVVYFPRPVSSPASRATASASSTHVRTNRSSSTPPATLRKVASIFR